MVRVESFKLFQRAIFKRNRDAASVLFIVSAFVFDGEIVWRLKGTQLHHVFSNFIFINSVFVSNLPLCIPCHDLALTILFRMLVGVLLLWLDTQHFLYMVRRLALVMLRKERSFLIQ